jgi:hypothetical protein
MVVRFDFIATINLFYDVSDANQNECRQGVGWIARESGGVCGEIALAIFHEVKIR